MGGVVGLLVAALEDLGDALREANPGWAVTVQVDDLLGPGTRVEPDLETAAFRIVQQACANAVQHSGGRALTVEGSVAGDLATHELRTDGGILAPAERIDEATRHVADGCWIYAGTGVREDGLRLFWIGGPR